MANFQNEVRREFRTEPEIAADTPVTLNVSMPPAVAAQLVR